MKSFESNMSRELFSPRVTMEVKLVLRFCHRNLEVLTLVLEFYHRYLGDD